MSEENGMIPDQSSVMPAPPPIGLNMQLTPQGIVLSFPVNLGIDNETMAQLVKAYLQAHPELMQELVQETLAQKQQELKIIQLVQRSKNN
jgi:hypothetical protein